MDNKQLYRAYLEALQKPELRGAILAPDFVAHDLPPPGGRDALIAFRRAVMSAFPDQTVEVPDLIAEGDRIAARFRADQTHLGAFRGIAPTGRKVSFEGYEIVLIESERIAARWTALKPSIAELIAQLTGR